MYRHDHLHCFIGCGINPSLCGAMGCIRFKQSINTCRFKSRFARRNCSSYGLEYTYAIRCTLTFRCWRRRPIYERHHSCAFKISETTSRQRCRMVWTLDVGGAIIGAYTTWSNRMSISQQFKHPLEYHCDAAFTRRSHCLFGYLDDTN